MLFGCTGSDVEPAWFKALASDAVDAETGKIRALLAILQSWGMDLPILPPVLLTQRPGS